MSDAGTPLVSDPGYKLARAVIEAGLPLHVIPGASAPLAALTLSGLRWLAQQLRWERLLDDLRNPATSPANQEEAA